MRLARLIAAVVVCGLAVPVSAGAAAPGTSAAPTSRALAPELSRLASPALRAASPDEQAAALGLPAEGPGSLVREGDRVVVEARFESGAVAAVDALEAAGAEVLLASGRYQTVAASVEPADLPALAAVPGVASVLPARAPIVYGAGEAHAVASAAGETCEGGSVVSEGLAQLNVTAARAAFGARGAGETIGVLSDSFDTATQAVFGEEPVATHAAQDEATGDLPGPRDPCSAQQVPVHVIQEGPNPGTDEGRAMLQAIHDLAPHAALAFATAYSTEVQFAKNIERLAEPVAAGGAGANVIVDDVGYSTEPFFQEGVVANAVRRVTEKGVVYLSAAGNANVLDPAGRAIGSWEAPEFRPIACPTAVQELGTSASPNCMDFNPGVGEDATMAITVPPGQTLSLDIQWAEPWYGVETDLDTYLLDEAGNKVLVNDGFWNYKTGEWPIPFEEPEWTNESGSAKKVQLVIGRCSGTCDSLASATLKPRVKVNFDPDGAGVSEIEYPESKGGDVVGPTIFGHSGSSAALSVGAIFYKESSTAPVEPEEYSSRGPVTNYFAPVNGTKAAKALGAPEVLQKPNFIATDCASNTFFGNFFANGWHFCGTSEAAPHAAAVAALMRQTEPHATPAGILAAMETSATPFTVVKARSAVGAGLVNARRAIEALGGGAVSDPPAAPVTPPTPPSPQPPAGGDTTPAPASNPAPTPAPETGTGVVKPPVARIAAHPAKLVKTRKRRVQLTFRFAADQSGAHFLCEFRPGRAVACPARVKRAFTAGPHRVVVRAVGGSGDVGRPASFSFRVERVRPRGHRH